MALNDSQKIHSLEHIFNLSFDKELQILGVELVGYDPLSGSNGALKRITTNAMGEYVVNDIEEIGALRYLGKEDMVGDWFVQKLDETSGTQIRFATVKNNTSITSYTDAWTNRASLTYGTYSQAF